MKIIKKLLFTLILLFGCMGIVGCEDTTITPPEVEQEKTKAPCVTNINVSYNVVTWDDPADVFAYKLYITINSVKNEFTVYNNSYNFQQLMDESVTEIKFEVVSIPGVVYDLESDPVVYNYTFGSTSTIKRAPTPTSFTISNNVARWSVVKDVTSYKITINANGQSETSIINTNSFDFSDFVLSNTKSIQFGVIAIAGDAYDQDSFTYSYTYTIPSDDPEPCTEHVDANNNGYCDNCGEEISTTDPTGLVIDHKEYYSSLKTFTGNALKLELRTLITNTHKKRTSYEECKQALPSTDADPNNSSNMILFYTNASIKKSTNMDIWNREHVWPKSLGWFNTSGAGADIHHLRPCNNDVNSARGNKKFGTSSGYYLPTDEYKGDVARIIFYLMVRYSESDKYSFTSVAQSKELLLAWNKLDPVSTLEINRNNKTATIQGNRNPFIDCPAFADRIWGS